MIAGITRVRNEELILEDTLRHFLGLVDRVYLYDDCSTDQTVEIACSFDRVDVVQGTFWDRNQAAAETRHRAKLLSYARHADMVLCFDADERIEGNLPTEPGAYRFALYDGYMTPERQQPYTGGPLVDLPRMWADRRDILMYFQPRLASYSGHGQREPHYRGEVQQANVKVRHYGKCLSVEHWEETCSFYEFCFPKWAGKWRARRGKAIHTESDFGRELVEWADLP